MSNYQHFEEDFRALYEYAPCGYLSSLLNGTIVAVNQTFLDLVDYTKDELISRTNFQDLLTTPGKIFYETQYYPLLQLQGFVNEVAFELVHKGGGTIHVLVTSTVQTGEKPDPFVRSIIFVATDRRQYERELVTARLKLEERVRNRTSELEREVANRKKAELGLKELTSKLLRLRDEERRRLARDLHDSAGQLLSITAINLANVAKEQNLSNEGRKNLLDATETVRETLKEIRVVSYLLHPPLLDESGLASALKWFVEGFSGRADVKIDLEIDASFPRLSQDMETAIFRIVQECLTNIHRHSESKTARLCVSCSNGEVRVEVRDQGKGIAADRPHGVGLRGMVERVGQFGGSMEIQSTAAGTAITATFPRSNRST